MYESPSLHLDIARQRHQQMLADAEQQRLAHALAKENGNESLVAVKGVFAGILAAVSSLGQRTRPVPQKPGLNTI